MWGMKHLALIPVLFCAAPLWAEAAPEISPDTAPPEAEDGWSLLREGSRLLLEQLFDEMAPALEDLEGFVGDLNAYEAPVILPNGDILIRRKPEPPQEATPNASDGAIDL